ncbi:MAG: creatininase family protein [Halobacteriales archaeon]
MYLADHAWPDLEAYFDRESLALLPVGATEQHGPHLPEGTDAYIAEALAREAADRTGYLCTPTVRVGVSPHHRQYHGTMWADAPAFRAYLESITGNLAEHGIDRVVFVNAHGGNVEHLYEVGRTLRAADGPYAIPWMWDESIPELVDELFEHNGPHGGPKETAMLQHLHPELVHDDRLEAARDGGTLELASLDGAFVAGARTFYDNTEISDNGVFGDQTDATAEKGRRLFEAATDQLVELCEWLAGRPAAALRPDEHV